MVRVNEKEWEIEINGFPVGQKFGSLRKAFQNFKGNGHQIALFDATGAIELWTLWTCILCNDPWNAQKS